MSRNTGVAVHAASRRIWSHFWITLELRQAAGVNPMIFRAKYVLPMDGSTMSDAEVLVRDGRIATVGYSLSATHPGEELVDHGNAILLPGFVNAHSHIEYTLERYRVDGLPLWQFLTKTAYRKYRIPEPKRLLESAITGAKELLAGGVTCFGDSSFSGIAAQAALETGQRAVIYHELFGQSMGDEYPAVLRARFETVDALRQHDPDTITRGVSPHSVYTSGPEMLAETNRLCLEYGMPLAMHLAETKAEAKYTMLGQGPLAKCRAKLGYDAMCTGTPPFQVVKEAGLVRKGVCFAHCTHLNKLEIAELAASGAGIAHCPRSNAYLLSGAAPLQQFVKEDAVVGIGTDGAPSCLTLDMLEEVRFALGLVRARTGRKSLTAVQALHMATLGGAKALGLDAMIGSIEPGKMADMIVVELNGPDNVTDAHLAVLSATFSQISRVYVNGRGIYTSP